MYIEGLDEIDNKIINLLRRDARMSYSDIGNAVGLSRVAVKNRIDQLENNGIIRGYTAVINSTAFIEGRRFFLEVITEPERFDEVIDNFARYDMIRRVYAITGQSRFHAEGFSLSTSGYESFMQTLNEHKGGIISYAVYDVMYTIKDSDGGVDYVRLDEREENRSK